MSDEIEREIATNGAIMSDLRTGEFLHYSKKTADEGLTPGESPRVALGDVREQIDASALEELEEGAEMAVEMLPKIDKQSFLEGHMTPVVFGTALRHFGVGELLSVLEEFAPAPRPQTCHRKDEPHTLNRDDKGVAGFVFKIQANMDPNHRDRVAFLRLCSGEFKRGMVDNGWADVDVQLKRRADLIPQLVTTVQAYASHGVGLLAMMVLKISK